MADAIYPNALEHFALGDIDWVNDTIKIIGVDAADYTYSSAHDALDDVPAAARVGTATLATKTATDGTLDAADPTMTSVTGDTFEALIVYVDSGVESTSYLICYIDSYTGLPLTPNGENVNITFPASGILSL